jgi:hypothetical protein
MFKSGPPENPRPDWIRIVAATAQEKAGDIQTDFSSPDSFVVHESPTVDEGHWRFRAAVRGYVCVDHLAFVRTIGQVSMNDNVVGGRYVRFSACAK